MNVMPHPMPRVPVLALLENDASNRSDTHADSGNVGDLGDRSAEGLVCANDGTVIHDPFCCCWSSGRVAYIAGDLEEEDDGAA